MTTTVVEKPCESCANACWAVLVTTFRDVTHAAHEVRLCKTIAADALEKCVFKTEHRIKQHPFAAVGAAFGIGIPAGLLMGWMFGHRGAAVRH